MLDDRTGAECMANDFPVTPPAIKETAIPPAPRCYATRFFHPLRSARSVVYVCYSALAAGGDPTRLRPTLVTELPFGDIRWSLAGRCSIRRRPLS